MKKIEALLVVVHPYLEDNRQTAVGISADSAWASDPAAGAPVASSLGPGSARRDFGWSMARADPAVGRGGPHSASAADSGVVGNFVRAKMPSAAGAGIGAVGHSHLVLPGPTVAVAESYLGPPQVPSPGSPDRCASIATIHDADGPPAVRALGGPAAHPMVSSVAAARSTVAASRETSHSPALPRLLNFRNSPCSLALGGSTEVVHRSPVVAESVMARSAAT